MMGACSVTATKNLNSKRSLLLGATLTLALLACGAAAHDYATRDELDALYLKVEALEDRVDALEAPLGSVGPLGTTWPGDDGR